MSSPRYDELALREDNSEMATTGKLETLRQRADKLKAQIAQLEAAEGARKRKEDTRLKVLVGAAILADVELHPETRAGVEAILKRGIVAPRDRDFLKAKGWI